MSGQGNDHSGKCLSGEMSSWGSVLREIVRSGKCPSGKFPSGKCQKGNCPRGSVSRGTVQSGNCPHTVVYRSLVYKKINFDFD